MMAIFTAAGNGGVSTHLFARLQSAGGRGGIASVSVNKVLLEQSHVHLFMYDAFALQQWSSGVVTKSI